MNPTATFDTAPDNLDVLFVPGGFGTVEAMKDQEIIDFLVRAGKSARYVTSVCTGWSTTPSLPSLRDIRVTRNRTSSPESRP